MKESVYKSFVSGDPHEEELLRQLIRGDIAGYEVLFHKYYPTFFAFIKGMTKETAVAEDIAQNIFMKVWLNREKLDAAKSIRNYLFVLAKHEIYNYFREGRFPPPLLSVCAIASFRVVNVRLLVRK